MRHEAQKYDWDVNIITAIAKAESGCRHDATGDGHLTWKQNGRTYGYSVSVLQVRILPGREHCDAHDIEINIRCAYAIYKAQGLSAWSVVNSGKYKQFL